MEQLRNRLRGLGVAMVTPFNADGTIDYVGLEKLINHLIDGGCDFLVSLGTTGETPSISDAERYKILDVTKTVNAGRIPIIAGFGGNDTAHVVKALNEYNMEGIDGILSVAPYYNKPNQEGLYLHFSAIAEACPVPIILYNVPSRTGCNIAAETTLRLANDYKNIIGVKEASGNFPQFMNILQHQPDDFIFLSGDDNLTYAMMAMGAEGVISVLGNSFPKEMSQMVHAVLDGDFPQAKTIHFQLLDLMQLIFKDGNPAGIKAILKIQGICGDVVRLPLANARPETFAEIEAAVEELYGALKA